MWIIESDNSMIEWLLPGAVDVWTLDMPSPGSSLLLANGNSNKYSFVVTRKGPRQICSDCTYVRHKYDYDKCVAYA